MVRVRQQLLDKLRQDIIGQDEVIELLLVCLLAGGHALFVGAPGLAKTLLVKKLARALELKFSRIQFTPDLMPMDITGSEVLEEEQASGRRKFRFIEGPVFCQLLLADEINRSPPKTQAALLQAMQEGFLSIGGKNYDLPTPFHVFATQNPIEQEGTYPLPEAQLDRFMLQIAVRYPDEASERAIITPPDGFPEFIPPPINDRQLRDLQIFVRGMPVPPSVVAYIVSLLRATRPGVDGCPPAVRELLQWGAGPRAGKQMVYAAQARAALSGRPAVTIADVRALAVPVLEHRLVRSFTAESQGISSEEILHRVLAAVPG